MISKNEFEIKTTDVLEVARRRVNLKLENERAKTTAPIVPERSLISVLEVGSHCLNFGVRMGSGAFQWIWPQMLTD